MDEQDTGAVQASDIFYGALEEAAGGEKGLGGADGGCVDVAVQDWLSLLIRHYSDDEESDDGWDDSSGMASSGTDSVLHQPLDWEGLCAYERALLTGAVVVGSRADVVDQGDVDYGCRGAGSMGGLERRNQASIDGTGFGAAVGVASCIQGPELQARFRADVGRMSRHILCDLRAPTGRRV